MATRVYKYGLVPIGYPPRAAIDELWRANNLGNCDVSYTYRNDVEFWFPSG